MKTEGHPRFARAVFALATALVCAGPLAAQQPPPPAAGAAVGATVRLSLDDALRLAEAQSPNIEVARSSVVRATGQRYQVRSQFFPQLNATAGYNKTLESQFSSFSASPAPVDTTPKLQALCTPNIPANATPDQRLAALAQSSSCQSSTSGGFDLSKTSFGAKNQWTLGLNFSQNVYTGGRITAQADAANAQLSSANIEVSAQRAQSALDVTSAYYDAALADQLVAIADSSVAQTEVVLAQTRVARQVGNAAEYDLLRAQVTHDNQLPAAIQARSNREVAYLRLKQLLNMPLDNVVQLTTQIETPQRPEPAVDRVDDGRHVGLGTRAGARARRGGARVRGADQGRARGADSDARDRVRVSTPLLPATALPELEFRREQLDDRSPDELPDSRRRADQRRPADRGGRRETGARAARADAPVRGARHARRVESARGSAVHVGSEQGYRRAGAADLRDRRSEVPRRHLHADGSHAVAAPARAVACEPRDGGAQPGRRARSARAVARPADPTNRNRRGSAQNATAQQQLQQQQQSQQQTNSSNQAARTPTGAGGTTGSIQP